MKVDLFLHVLSCSCFLSFPHSFFVHFVFVLVFIVHAKDCIVHNSENKLAIVRFSYKTGFIDLVEKRYIVKKNTHHNFNLSPRITDMSVYGKRSS